MLLQQVCPQPRNRLVSFDYCRVEKIDRLSLAVLAESIRHPRELRAIPIRSIRAKRHSVAEKAPHFFFWHVLAIEPASIYPNSEAWGVDGFTFTDKDAAFAKLREIFR